MSASALKHVVSVLRYVWNHPANEGGRARALARALSWQFYKRATARTLDISLYGDYKLRCYPDSTAASAALYAAGYPDWSEMAFIQHYLRTGDGFVDVGANVGVYTLLAASLVGPDGRVASFEPEPKALKRLRENISLNRLNNVEVHPFAVSDKSGTISFDPAAGTTGHMVEGEQDRPGALQASSVRLDDVLPGDGWSMGKMDIEGAEPLALRGAERLLAEMNPPVWLLEVNGCLKRYGFTEEQLWGWLDERQWDVYLYEPAQRRLQPCTTPSSKHHNVLVVARGAFDRVSARVRNGGP